VQDGSSRPALVKITAIEVFGQAVGEFLTRAIAFTRVFLFDPMPERFLFFEEVAVRVLSTLGEGETKFVEGEVFIVLKSRGGAVC
jgi:hypothetical protein